jgi:hypothetical protein
MTRCSSAELSFATTSMSLGSTDGGVASFRRKTMTLGESCKPAANNSPANELFLGHAVTHQVDHE